MYNQLPQISKDSTEIVLENFESYRDMNFENISSPSRITEMFSIDESFNAFTDSLIYGNRETNPVTEDTDVVNTLKKIYDRERTIITEAISNGVSSVAHGWMVNIFPILTDIYSDPILNQIMTVHVSKSPVFSLTRTYLEATVGNSDGTTTTTRFPSSTDLIRGKQESITVLPNKENNLFAAATVTLDYRTSTINKSFFHIYEITVSDDDDGAGGSGGGPNAQTIEVTIRPTGRDNTPYTFQFKSGNSPTGQTVEGKVLGQVDWDKGTYTYSITYTNLDNPASPVTYTTTNAKCKVLFTSKKHTTNRVDVALKSDTWDIEIGVREDFRIPLDPETIQDYQALYNIDMLRTMTLGIKTQMLLNKDIDLATMLQMYEPEMKTLGNNSVANLALFEVGGGKYTPAEMQNVFRGAIQAGLEETNASIYKNLRAWPGYLVCGRAAHAVVKSLQPTVYNSTDPTKSGTIGMQPNGISTIGNQKVIRSDALPTNKIYHIYKPGTDDPGRASILDIVHWPLYVMEELTDATKYTYLRSRSTIEIVNTKGLGVTEIQGYEDYFGKL